MPAHALIRVAETETYKDMARGKATIETRMFIAYDGDTEALGWVTGRAGPLGIETKCEMHSVLAAGAGWCGVVRQRLRTRWALCSGSVVVGG